MKLKLITLLLIISKLSVFAQGENPYGPLPYHKPDETIGENYYVVFLSDQYHQTKYYFLKKIENGKPVDIATESGGKLIKLISIENNIGHFKDADSIEYTDELLPNDPSFGELIPVSEFENGKKLLLNKTIWLNKNDIRDLSTKFGAIKINRFEPVTVTDVKYGPNCSYPIKLVLKSPTGKIGWEYISVSGTNTDLDPKEWFNTKFFLENPRLKYHFTPAVWQMVKDGIVKIGMPMDAVILLQGNPTDIHTTKTASGTSVQLVYGHEVGTYRYYYFAHDKLTSIQD